MDESLFWALNAASTSRPLELAALCFSSRWMLAVVGVPILVILGRRKDWAAIVSVALAIGVSDLVVSRVIKPAVGRQRPCRVLEGVRVPAGCGPAKSFPSAHASNAFAFSVAASTAIPAAVWVLVPVASLVALSRVVLGVHYPSDIFAGAVFGALLGALAYFARSRVTRTPTNDRPSDPSSTSETDPHGP